MPLFSLRIVPRPHFLILHQAPISGCSAISERCVLSNHPKDQGWGESCIQYVKFEKILPFSVSRSYLRYFGLSEYHIFSLIYLDNHETKTKIIMKFPNVAEVSSSQRFDSCAMHASLKIEQILPWEHSN